MDNKFESKQKTVYSCGYCGKLYYEKEQADLCHNDRTCGTCGKVVGKTDYYVNCYDCRQNIEAQKEADLFEKAEKITYDEYVKQFPDNLIFFDDHYYAELEDLEDIIYVVEEYPKYVWATTAEKVELDYGDILERYEEGVRLEEYSVDKVAVNELKDFCKQWNEKYAETVYWQNEKLAIVL